MAVLEAHRTYLLVRSVIALFVVPIVFGAVFGVFVFVKAPWYLFAGLGFWLVMGNLLILKMVSFRV